MVTSNAPLGALVGEGPPGDEGLERRGRSILAHAPAPVAGGADRGVAPAPDHADPVTFAVADGGKLKHYLFDAVGPEIVRTARGQFNTVVVQRRQAEHNPRRTQLWLAPRLHYLPVRIRHTERDEGVFELRLERYLAGDGDRNAR